MTLEDASRDYQSRNPNDRSNDRSNERVDVTDGYPTDRVRWGPVIAGTFVALTTLAILGTLGAAVGFSTYDRGQDDVRNFAMAGGVWGIISTIIAFALGGFIAARAAAVHGRDNGMLNGALVAAVGLPLMLFMFGGAATAMSSAELANKNDQQARSQSSSPADRAVVASARMSDTTGSGESAASARPSADDVERGRKAASRTAWSALAAMVLAVGASALAGRAGGQTDDGYSRRGHGNRDAGVTA